MMKHLYKSSWTVPSIFETNPAEFLGPNFDKIMSLHGYLARLGVLFVYTHAHTFTRGGIFYQVLYTREINGFGILNISTNCRAFPRQKSIVRLRV